jgi:peroxiredoxin
MAKRMSNLIFLLVIAILLAQKIPVWIDQYDQEGAQANPLTVLSLEDSLPISLPLKNEPHLLVFWATWCRPCSIELARINNLIESHKIPASRVIAISSGEPQTLVQQHVRDKKYLFQVALDSDFQAVKSYKVRGTPTLILIDQNGKIDWVTLGLSPSLELRLIQALSGTQEEMEVL